MTEGEGFQIVIWDVINKKKAEKATKKGEYINSGQVILKTINLEQVRYIFCLIMLYFRKTLWHRSGRL